MVVKYLLKGRGEEVQEVWRGPEAKRQKGIEIPVVSPLIAQEPVVFRANWDVANSICKVMFNHNRT
jgi:hypothetical protein